MSSAAMIIVDGGKGFCTSWHVKTIKRTQLLRKIGQDWMAIQQVFFFSLELLVQSLLCRIFRVFWGFAAFFRHRHHPRVSDLGFSVTSLAGESNCERVEVCVCFLASKALHI